MAFIAKRLPLGDRISPALATELELALHIVSACFSAGLDHNRNPATMCNSIPRTCRQSSPGRRESGPCRRTRAWHGAGSSASTCNGWH